MSTRDMRYTRIYENPILDFPKFPKILVSDSTLVSFKSSSF